MAYTGGLLNSNVKTKILVASVIQFYEIRASLSISSGGLNHMRLIVTVFGFLTPVRYH